MEMEHFQSKRILDLLPRIRCELCGRDATQVTLTLMMGKRGYRRYPVCDKCLATQGDKLNGTHKSTRTG